jgi:hypothetical protein
MRQHDGRDWARGAAAHCVARCLTTCAASQRSGSTLAAHAPASRGGQRWWRRRLPWLRGTTTIPAQSHWHYMCGSTHAAAATRDGHTHWLLVCRSRSWAGTCTISSVDSLANMSSLTMEDRPWAKGEGGLLAIPRRRGCRGGQRAAGGHGRANELGNEEAKCERGAAGARASVNTAAWSWRERARKERAARVRSMRSNGRRGGCRRRAEDTQRVQGS